MNDPDLEPGPHDAGRLVRKTRKLAIGYSAISLFLISAWGSGRNSGSPDLFAFLYSWVGLIGKVMLPLLSPVDSYWGNMPLVIVIVMPIYLFAVTVLYLFLLFLVSRVITPISRIAGFASPLLFHFLGSYFVLMPLKGSEGLAFDTWSFISLTVVGAYFLISWRMIRAESD